MTPPETTVADVLLRLGVVTKSHVHGVPLRPLVGGVLRLPTDGRQLNPTLTMPMIRDQALFRTGIAR
jgi:hypothetical protein